MINVDEPLHLSAPLAWRLAPQLCHSDSVTQQNCAWSHGIWQYLRLMGLGGSPAINADFYRHAFAAVTGSAGPPEILISGTADYAMLAHVLPAFRQHGIEPLVTVVDICDTPLWFNRWYAERMACRISTYRCDIAAFEASRTFDVICTHSFFGQIPHARRPALLEAWQRLLRPGGVAISVDRLRPAAGEAPVGFSEQQARTFCMAVERKAAAMRDSLQIDPVELAKGADVYTRRQRLYPVRTGEEIRALFERGGFALDELACGPNETGTRQEDSGPAIPSNAEYARVIARRR